MSASIGGAQGLCSGEGYAGATGPAVHVADIAGKMDLGSRGGRCLHGGRLDGRGGWERGFIGRRQPALYQACVDGSATSRTGDREGGRGAGRREGRREGTF